MVLDRARVPLVGRAAEVRTIAALVRSTAQGQGRCLLLEGEAGIGKSRLVGEALAAADRHGMVVLRARAEELDSRRPFGAISTCLGFTARPTHARRAEIARLLFGDIPEAAEVSTAEDGPPTEFRLVEAMVAYVEELCVKGPVALAVDDLQWADPGTLHVLNHLGRVVEEGPLFLCCAFRPAPRPPELSRLVRGLAGRGATAMTLSPIGPADVTELLTSVLGIAPGPKLVRQAAATGGNPFYVTELVAALQATGSLRHTDAMAELDSAGLPPALKLTVLLELSFLSDKTQELLRTASVLGSSFTVDALALVLEQSPVALLPGLREAIEANVLVEDDIRVAFRHDLLREALYTDVPRPLRAGMHLHIARRLAAAGASPLEVAEHFVRGASRGDAVALDYLRQAAVEAMLRAPAIGADLLQRAVDLFEPGDPERDALLVEYVLCLEGMARHRQAWDVASDLLARRQPPHAEARLRMFRSRSLNSRCEHEQAMLQAAQAEAIDGLSPEQRARVASVSSQLLLHPPRLEQAEATAFRARDMAGDDPITLGTAAYTLATVALQRGRYSEALGWAAEPQRVIRDNHPERRMSMGFQHLREMTQMLVSQALLRLDRVEEADQALTTARQAVRAKGFGGLATSGQALMVDHQFARGDWDDVVTEFDALMDVCAELGHTHYAVELAAGARALVALHRGDHHTAGATISVAEQVEGRGPYNGQLVVLARALLAESGGSPGEALEILATTWDAAVGMGVVSVCLSLGPDLVRLARAQGDLDRALATSHQIDLLDAANPGVASIAGAALRCRGLAVDDVSLLVRAAAAFRGGPRPLEGALTCEDAADALARSGDRPAARPLFGEAVQGYERLGAAWDAARAGARMRVHGIRRGRRWVHVRATSGWDALTRGERAVVELVAEGLSNAEVAERLFLSRHTIKRHLANAMVKLGLTSRIELAREASRLGV